MTQEEKAKAYDEAIKRAKDFEKGEVHFALKPGESIVHWIFPELADSTDEKIRKILIDRLLRAEELTDGLRDLLITYLEKQKEQKPRIEIELPNIGRNKRRNITPLCTTQHDTGRKTTTA